MNFVSISFCHILYIFPSADFYNFPNTQLRPKCALIFFEHISKGLSSFYQLWETVSAQNDTLCFAVSTMSIHNL